ncbi:MAG TPA: TonB-dependent receptor, partial [Alphaproteobacteria bacterium]
ADEIMCAEEVADDGAEAEAEVILDQFGNVVPLFAAHHGALNTSSTQTSGYGLGLQGAIDEDLFGHTNQLVVGGSIDLGETEFHSESGIGVLNLNRSVTAGPEPFENTAIFEFETDGVTPEGEVARGEIGPARAVAENTYYGIYVSDTFDVTDNLAVTLAGRFNHADIKITDELDSYFPREVTLAGDHSFSRFNPAAGATYTFPQLRTTAFASYAEANRAPSPAELTCAEPTAPCRLPNSFVADPDLEQVVARTFEAGVRGNLPDDWLGAATSLDWALSFFHSENSNDIIFVSAGPALGTGFFQNVDKTRRRGVEAGLGGNAGRARWFVNYSFIEATFESGFTVASPNHPRAVDGEIMIEAGDDIPGIPQHNFGLGVDVEVLDGLTVGTSVVAKSGVYLRGDEANLLERTDSYAVVNFRTSYRIAEWLEVFGRIENLFNTDYETFGVLGEAEGTDGAVPIYELPGGVTDPRFLSPGQPFAAFIGMRIRLN